MSKKKLQPRPPVSIPKSQEIKTHTPRSLTWLLEIAAILMVVFLAYGNSITNDYNMDDSYVVSLDNTNPLTQKGIKGIPEILKSNYNTGVGVTYGYRPLGKVTMAIEYSLWQNNPHYSHFINILLYALNVYLLLLFFKKIAEMLGVKYPSVLYAGILLFILHPIHTEVVCSIKNREELLCFSLMLGALLCFFKFYEDRKWWYMIPFVILISLAYLAKESAVNIAGIILLIIFLRTYVLNEDRSFKWKNIVHSPYLEKLKGAFIVKRIIIVAMILFVFMVFEDLRGIIEILLIATFLISLMARNSRKVILANLKKIVASKIAMSIISLGMIVLIFVVAKYFRGLVPVGDIGTHFEQNPYHFFSLRSDFAIGVQTYFFYFKKLIFPFPLLFYYGFDMLPVQGWDTLLPYAGILFFLVIILWVVYSFKKKKMLFAAFSFLFFLGTLFPFTNFFPSFYVTGIVAERLSYQASAGFCMFFAALFFFLSDIVKNKFQGQSAVSGDKIKYILTGFVAVIFLMMTINRNGDWKDKSTLFKHDIKYLGNSARANYMMASRYMNEINSGSIVNREEISNNVQLASSYLHRALQIYPEYNDAWSNLAIIQYQFFSNRDSALICFNKVDTTNRFVYARAREYLGDITYNDLKNKEQAKAYYLQGYQYMPERKILYQKITQILFETMRYDSILIFSSTGIKNNFTEAYVDKADAFVNLRDTLSAIPYYKTALARGYDRPLLINLNSYLHEPR